VIYAYIERLADYSKRRSASFEAKIFEALKHCRMMQPKDIVGFINSQTEIEAVRKYEKGEIAKTEISTETKKLSVSRESVSRKLNKFLTMGLVGKKGLKYFLTEKAESDPGYFPSLFGDVLLESLMEQHFPSISKLDENFLWLIQLFGLHIMICFIEAARPADYFGNLEAASMSHTDRDRLVISFIDQVINVKLMYKYFLEAIRNQPQDKIVEENRKHLSRDEIMGCLEFDEKYATKMGILRYPTADYGNDDMSHLIKKKEVDNCQSQYELDKDIVNRLLSLISKMNPELYANVMGNSISKLWARSGGPAYLDDNNIRPPKETLILGRKRRKRASKAG
jgi:hypothetical protein